MEIRHVKGEVPANSAITFHKKITNLGIRCPILRGSRAQKIQKVSPKVPLDVRKVSSTFDHHYPSLCGGRNTKSNGVTPEAQLQLRVKLGLGD